MPASDDTARRLLRRSLELARYDAATNSHPHEREWSSMLAVDIRAYLAAQPKDEEPRRPPHALNCATRNSVNFRCDCGVETAPTEPPAPTLIRHKFVPPPLFGAGADYCRFYTGGDPAAPWAYCGEPRSRHAQPTEEPPPVVHPSESIPKR